MSLDWKPARLPERAPLEGRTVRLEPVDPGRHPKCAFRRSSSGAPELWNHLAYGPFANQDVFTGWLEERAASDDPLFYAVVDRGARRAGWPASADRAAATA